MNAIGERGVSMGARKRLAALAASAVAVLAGATAA